MNLRSVREWAKSVRYRALRLEFLILSLWFLFVVSSPIIFELETLDSERYRLGGEEALYSKGMRNYLLAIDSFDPDLKQVKGTLRLKTYQLCPEKLPNEIKGLAQRCIVSPVEIKDLSLHLRLYGSSPDPNAAKMWDQMFIDSAKGVDWYDTNPTTFTLPVLGNPARFPFDRYLAIGDVEQLAAYIPSNGHHPVEIPLAGSRRMIDFNVPAFVAETIGKEKLSEWTFSPPLQDIWSSSLGEPLPYWQDHVFYFEIKRPLELRVLTIVLGFVSLLSVVVVTSTVEIGELVKTLGASFLSLWALRSILANGGPKVPTILDYGVLLLFSVQISIIAYRLVVRRKTPEPAGSPGLGAKT